MRQKGVSRKKSAAKAGLHLLDPLFQKELSVVSYQFPVVSYQFAYLLFTDYCLLITARLVLTSAWPANEER